MKAFYCDHFELPIRRGSRFPVAKYAALRRRIQLSEDLPIELLESRPLTEAELLTIHTPEYIRRVRDGTMSEEEQRRLGFPWSAALWERSLRSAGGTMMACKAALEDGAAANLAGGTHHAFRDRGSGYCLFNDVAIAAVAIRKYLKYGRVLIVDADVHQGDGTADILKTDPDIYTYSIHCNDNFPREKSTSNLDIGLPKNTGDAVYLREFTDGLKRACLASRPEMIVYLAGADPYVGDRLGGLAVSKSALLERDELVVTECRRRRIPLAAVMGGGYAKDVNDIVDIHVQTIRTLAGMGAHL